MSFITADDSMPPEPEDPIAAIRWREQHHVNQSHQAIGLLLIEIDKLTVMLEGLAFQRDLIMTAYNDASVKLAEADTKITRLRRERDDARVNR
jgi:hypothetical protein